MRPVRADPRALTTLWLVRHGRTEANALGLLLGREDPPLDGLGRRQAEAISPVVAGASHVVSSPLTRARETAEVLGLGAVEVDERWIEIDYGELEGCPVQRVPSDVWEAWRADARYRPPGGESLADVASRVAAACDELMDSGEEGVVVVSHVTPIKLALAWALGVPEAVSWRMHLSVASVSRIETVTDRPVVHSYNDTCHLEVS